MKPAKKSTMDEYLKKHPFLKETAGLHLGLEKILSQLVKPVSFPEKADLIAYTKEGLPLLQQAGLQKRMAEAAAAGLGSMLAGLNDLMAPVMMKAAIEKWQEWAVQAEPETIQHFFGFLMRQEDGEIHELAETNQLNETMIRFLGWALIDALVPARVKDSSFWEHEAKWKRNYCPVCGRQAALAQLRKEQQGRARYLSCDGCHTVWPHKRIGCVYCQNIDLKKMHILEPEGEPEMRLDVCDECHTYLKTYNEEGAEDVYLRDWATIHLDLLGEEQGLRKKGSVLLASE